MDRIPAPTAELSELDTEACYAHLGTQSVGRLAFDGREGITVLPVNYVVRDHEIVIATSAFGAIARESRGRVGFEVDDIDSATQSGWSVLVRGTIDFDENGLSLRHEHRTPRPWPAGLRTLRLAIRPYSVSGRRLGGPETWRRSP